MANSTRCRISPRTTIPCCLSARPAQWSEILPASKGCWQRTRWHGSRTACCGTTRYPWLRTWAGCCSPRDKNRWCPWARTSAFSRTDGISTPRTTRTTATWAMKTSWTARRRRFPSRSAPWTGPLSRSHTGSRPCRRTPQMTPTGWTRASMNSSSGAPCRASG